MTDDVPTLSQAIDAYYRDELTPEEAALIAATAEGDATQRSELTRLLMEHAQLGSCLHALTATDAETAQPQAARPWRATISAVAISAAAALLALYPSTDTPTSAQNPDITSIPQTDIAIQVSGAPQPVNSTAMRIKPSNNAQTVLQPSGRMVSLRIDY